MLMQTSRPLWNAYRENIALRQHEVHLWRISLDQPPAISEHLSRCLSTDEKQRASQFYFERDRKYWANTRGFLRKLLGLYLHMKPDKILFSYNSNGKPSVAWPSHAQQLQFNLSYFANIALYAFAYNRNIGVDVEYMNPEVDYDKMALYHFSPYEYQTLRTIPQEFRLYSFYQCWTRKEAYIKARGLGSSLALDQFDVALKPEEDPALLASKTDPDEVTRWSFREITPSLGYAGTLVVEGMSWQLTRWQWPENFPG